MYQAHRNEDTGQIQSVKEHCENTAALAAGIAAKECKEVVYAMGLLHDVGKYQPSFQKRICGENIRVEHSTCGALAARKHYTNAAAWMMAYCISGHHTGIPDGMAGGDTADLPTLAGRMKRSFEDFSAYERELELPKLAEKEFQQFLLRDCRKKEQVYDKFAFFTRYCFSCLVDADSLDTAIFMGGSKNRSLKADFAACLEKLEKRFDSFVCQTELQKARGRLQAQAFQNAEKDGEIYLMHMPTGSGKTLCSMKVALQRVLRENSGKKRIIYIIPYNSIIEQTAEVFQDLFGKDMEILRHQSTFSYDDADMDEDERKTAKLACENWDAQVIITTAVQFFESIYSNRRSRLRKLHNMADSILIFDEAHLMPEGFLQPCLEAIVYLTRYLNSEAIFLTATMPDFKELLQRYTLPDSTIVDLITDTSAFGKFAKCSFADIGFLSEEALLQRAMEAPSALIVVNEKKTARELYEKCSGRKYHLSTYMTAFDRKEVIAEIRGQLAALEEAYPDLQQVPEEKRITVISTSLIEAGVDLDFSAVYRELAGLDSILQAGGRCNREGKRSDAMVSIFRLKEKEDKPLKPKEQFARESIMAFPDISSLESIDSYYRKVFSEKNEEFTKYAMEKYCRGIESIDFQTYAAAFALIEQKNISVVALRDEESRALIEDCRRGFPNSRRLQKYTFSIRQKELEELQKQHVVENYDGIWCLTSEDYYDKQLGVLFSGQDYII
ncbi:CRISPR-associated helicase Cas3' [Anaerotignum sp.]